MTTGFMYDSRFLEHDAGRGHPERRERLLSTMAWLESRDWFADLVRIDPAMADPVWIETVHDASYIARADETCRSGAPFLDVADVGISHQSSDVARLAAGGALAMADRIVAGDVNNGFALSRPPGHHAERGMALGFCLFNNVAVAARYLQRAHGVDKILILDFDVHHGNGTQHTFEEDPSVMYASIHQYPYYPGTGAASETGIGRGAGATVNCPVAAGAGDEEYQRAFNPCRRPSRAGSREHGVLWLDERKNRRGGRQARRRTRAVDAGGRVQRRRSAAMRGGTPCGSCRNRYAVTGPHRP